MMLKNWDKGEVNRATALILCLSRKITLIHFELINKIITIDMK